jgi:hypothetical protein
MRAQSEIRSKLCGTSKCLFGSNGANDQRPCKRDSFSSLKISSKWEASGISCLCSLLLGRQREESTSHFPLGKKTKNTFLSLFSFRQRSTTIMSMHYVYIHSETVTIRLRVSYLSQSQLFSCGSFKIIAECIGISESPIQIQIVDATLFYHTEKLVIPNSRVEHALDFFAFLRLPPAASRDDIRHLSCQHHLSRFNLYLQFAKQPKDTAIEIASCCS